MTNIDYVNGALLTEAPVTPEMTARFLNHDTISRLNSFLDRSIDTADDLDRMKRHLFYGKDPDGAVSLRTVAPAMGQRVVDNIRLLHALIGFLTEAGEIAEAITSHIFSPALEVPNLNAINLIEEGGDLFWYMAIFADALSVTFDDMQDRNLRKLSSRYPDKFTEFRALNRDLGEELEQLRIPHAGISNDNPGVPAPSPKVNILGGPIFTEFIGYKEAEAATEKIKRGLEKGQLQRVAPSVAKAMTEEGRLAVIHSIDQQDGYLYGQLDGQTDSMTWGWPDGRIVLSQYDSRYNLDMSTFEVIS